MLLFHDAYLVSVWLRAGWLPSCEDSVRVQAFVPHCQGFRIIPDVVDEMLTSYWGELFHATYRDYFP